MLFKRLLQMLPRCGGTIASIVSFQRSKKTTVALIWGFQFFEPLQELYATPPVHAYNCKGQELDLQGSLLGVNFAEKLTCERGGDQFRAVR